MSDTTKIVNKLAHLKEAREAVDAWHPSLKVAFDPPTESGSTYAIPPELAPQDILDAAQIDDHGKPQ